MLLKEEFQPTIKWIKSSLDNVMKTSQGNVKFIRDVFTFIDILTHNNRFIFKNSHYAQLYFGLST